jgi:hypothetical protein
MQAAEYYIRECEREVETVSVSYGTLPVLEFLCGQVLDDFAWSCIWALKPTKVRIIRDSVTLNACCGRASIYLEGDRIQKIEQEVEIACFGDIQSGEDWEVRVDALKPYFP